LWLFFPLIERFRSLTLTSPLTAATRLSHHGISSNATTRCGCLKTATTRNLHGISRYGCFANGTMRCGRFFPPNERFRTLIRLVHEDSQAKVVIEKKKTESFNVNVGVGQGDVFISHFVQLSSGYYKKLDIKRNTSTIIAHINACVDDVGKISRNVKA
jgi:hypothetical protein